MPDHQTPDDASEQTPPAEDVLFRALDALVHGRTDPWVAMFHEDGVMEFPYAPAGHPTRLQGRIAIAAYMRTYSDHVALERVTRTAVHHCGATLVAEFVGEGVAVPAGRRFVMPYVAVLTVHGGEVLRYRDYWDPLVALRAAGGLDAVATPAHEDPRPRRAR